jgi:hypothetical protein
MMNTGLGISVAAWIQTIGGKRRPQSDFILDRPMKEHARYGASSYWTFAEARGGLFGYCEQRLPDGWRRLDGIPS